MAAQPTRSLSEASANVVLSLAALLAAVAMSWWIHSAVNFGYPLLYDALAIDEHIATYAPQNRYRDGFEATSRDKHMALFGGIVTAINRGGEGLEALRYQTSSDGEPVPLLREAETHHLTAVAGLVTVLHWTGVVGLLILVLTIAVMRWRRMRLWRLAPLLGLGMALVVAMLIAIVALDTRDDGWFAWAHDALFGTGHQWFFYYQESLMTTLLKAPDLFAPLGVSLGVVAVALAALFYALARRLLSIG